MKIPFLTKKQNKTLLVEARQTIESISKSNDVLAICPQPTGYSWLGVNVATKSLFPNNTFEIPQNYSNSIFTDLELNKLVNVIYECGFKQIILSGYPPYFYKIVEKMRKTNPQIKIKVIFHGFLSELSENIILQKVFSNLIEFVKARKITSIGFIKAGMAKTVSKVYNLKCTDLVLPTHLQGEIRKKPTDEIHIGCLVNNSFRKNLHNQVNAALMLENAIVHVFENDDLNYLPQDRLVQHKLMDHESFIKLLGSMHINLHVTYSESWGQVLSESIALGVPCLSAYTSAYFDYDDNLRKALLVDGFDDSWHIYNKLKTVLTNYNAIAEECLAYADNINNLSIEKMKGFIDA